MGQIVSDITSILDYKKDKKRAGNERQKILMELAENEKNKANLVKKVLASQRAKYGASGMSGRGMTEGAVLKRLESETEEPYETKRRTRLDKLRNIRVKKPNLLKSLIARFDNLFK